MPVFTQSAGASRDLRVQLSRGRPLPRVQDMKDASDVHEFYDVVVAGVSRGTGARRDGRRMLSTDSLNRQARRDYF